MEEDAESRISRRQFLRSAAVALTAAKVSSAGAEAERARRRDLQSGLPRRTLGRTGEPVSVVGFGGYALHALSQRDATAALRGFIDRGVNHLDVAPSYLTSEAKMGRALRDGYRDKVFLAGKTLERGRDGARRKLEQTLRRLETDHLDLYQFHAVDTMEELDQILAPGGAMEAFEKAKEQGLIRFIGITGHHAGVQLEALRRYDFASLMIPVNFVDRFHVNAEAGLLQFAREKGVGVIAIKATFRGQIADVRTAYRYALSQSITNTIPAASVDEHNAVIDAMAELTPMSIEEMASIFRESPYLGKEVCRQCHMCLPCPAGIDVPYLFALEGYAKRYRRGHVRAMYRRLKAKGSACIECGKCTQRCPFGLDAMNRIRSMDKTLGG